MTPTYLQVITHRVAQQRPTAEQAEIARLRRQLDLAQRRLSTTEAALDIMGKTHALLEEISKSAPDRPAPKKR